MARPQLTAVSNTENPVVDATPQESLENHALVSADQNQTRRVEQALQLDFEYTTARALDVLMAESQLLARSWMRMSLIIAMVKERESAEVFADVIQTIGISPAHARRFVSCAQKFRTRPEFHRLDKSKVLALCGLDSDTLDDMQQGSILDLKLDDVDRMTTTELRDRVRQLREEKSAAEERLTTVRSEKDAALDKLEQREKDLKDKRKKTGLAFGDFSAAYGNLCAAISSFHQFNEALLLAAETASPLNAPQQDAVAQMFGDLRDLAEKISIGRTEEGNYV